MADAAASGKNTPLAKGVRTFLQTLSGTITTVVAIDLTTQWRHALETLTLGFVAAVIAGAAAYLLALSPLSTTNRLRKALYTFAQALGGGLGALGLSALTADAAIQFGDALARLVMASAVSAILSYLQNASEDAAPVTPVAAGGGPPS